MKKFYFLLFFMVFGIAPIISAQTTLHSDDFKFSIYPNPVNNILNINTQEILTKMEVVDMLGRTVLTEKNISKSIDLSNLNKGIYILKLISEKGISTKKLIKN